MPFPYVDVHMTKLDKRGLHSVTAEAAVGALFGFGVRSYTLGLEALLQHLAERDGPARGVKAAPAHDPGGRTSGHDPARRIQRHGPAKRSRWRAARSRAKPPARTRRGR